MALRRHVIRDVLHGYITFDDDDRLLLDTPFVQRLRFIRQNDVGFFVYPSLNTTRFEHSIGVAHVAATLAEAALTNASQGAEFLGELREFVDPHLPREDVEEVPDSFVRAARWYGLLHDIGHLPFSHLTERCLERFTGAMYPGTTFRKPHEAAGQAIMKMEGPHREVMARHPRAAWLVNALMTSKTTHGVLRPLKDIVDSDVDADRIDSTARDGQLAGGDFGNYDSARLMRDAVLIRHAGEWRVMFTTRALSSIEGLLHERHNTHRWIHFQPKVVALKNAYRVAFEPLADNGMPFLAAAYVSAEGYLDDGRVMASLSRPNAGEPLYVAHARSAMLSSRASARPLWKRRDEFVEVCGDVAAGNGMLRAAQERAPVINRLLFDAGLEDALNDGLDETVRLMVFPTSMDPFEKSKIDAAVGTYEILRHSDQSPILLTNESRLVQSLSDVVAHEPAISVTAIGEAAGLDARMPDLRDRFVEVARARLIAIQETG